MGNLLTPTHLIIILLIVLVLFGRGRISEFMGDFGKGIKSFKKGLKESDEVEAEDSNQTLTRTIDARREATVETMDTPQIQKTSVKAAPKKAAASARAKTTSKSGARTSKATPRSKAKR